MAQLDFHTGFFAIPAKHLDEIARLDEISTHATRASQDDSLVRANDVYRAAAAVAVHRVEIVGDPESDWFCSMVAALERKLRIQKNQDIFFPQEVHSLAERVRDTERQLGGEDAVVARIQRRDPKDKAPDVIRAVYRAFKQVLFAASERGTGFVWTMLFQGAEDRLAEDRRKQAEREAEARKPRTQSIESEIKSKQEAIAQLEAWSAQFYDPFANEPSPKREADEPVHFGVMPRDHVLATRRLLLKAERTGTSLSETVDLQNQARKQAADLVTHKISLHRRGEVAAGLAIFYGLMDVSPGAVQIIGAYTPAQTRKLLTALDRWQADQGMGRLLDHVLSQIPGNKSRSLTANAYHKLKEVLNIAVEEGHGFYRWMW